MSRTITALFDDRSDAEATRDRLSQAGVAADDVHIHDRSSDGYREAARSTQDDRGFWASIRNVFLPDPDRHLYEEGVRRGGYLLTADLDDETVADAVRILEAANTVDIDARAESWRASGWIDGSVAADAAAAGYGLDGSPDRPFSQAGDDVAPARTASIYGSRDLDRGSARPGALGLWRAERP